MNFESFLEKYQKAEFVEVSHSLPDRVKVSVNVQTYRHAPFIKECLESVLAQRTDFDFEILIGEDFSDDGTREICMEYAERFPGKIRLFLHERANNISVSGRPTGRFVYLVNLFSARGKYIAYCEGDDYWTDPEKLQKQADFLDENPEYVISHHDFRILDERNGALSVPKYDYRHDFSPDRMVSRSHMNTNTVMFRNVITEIPEDFLKVLSADQFLYSMLAHHGRAKYQSDIGPSVYRLHEGGIWSTLSEVERLDNKIKNYTLIKRNSDPRFHPGLDTRLVRLDILKLFAFRRSGDGSATGLLLRTALRHPVHFAAIVAKSAASKI